MSDRVDYFIDTEFNDGAPGISLISIGIIDEKGREYYAISEAYDPDACNRYVAKHVLPRLGDDAPQSLLSIQRGITEFIGKDRPAFWGYCPAFDWVLFSWLWKGGLANMPKKWPKYCLCVRQLALNHNIPASAFPPKPERNHHALEDARWARDCHGAVMNRLGKDQIVPRRSDTDCGEG